MTNLNTLHEAERSDDDLVKRLLEIIYNVPNAIRDGVNDIDKTLSEAGVDMSYKEAVKITDILIDKVEDFIYNGKN